MKMKLQFNFFVLAGILALAVLLGVLNNLRVSDERKAKWFGVPDRVGLETSQEVAP